MKWLIIQSNGEHEANRMFRECFAVQHALVSLSHSADIWGFGHVGFGQVPDFNSYDFILCLENYKTDWIPDYSKSRAKKLYWIIDLHARMNTTTYYKITGWSDIILHATKHLIASYANLHPNKQHFWFPNAVDTRLYNGVGVSADKVSNVVFVGSRLKARQAFLDQIASRTPLEQVFAIGPEMIRIVSGAKIHFNRNINRDINYRTFETIGIGTCLVTDDDPDLRSLGFEDGRNCLLYRNPQEAVAKINDSLRYGTWELLSLQGFNLSRLHTYERRFEALSRTLGI